MSRFQGMTHIARNLENFLDRQRAANQARFQSLALKKLDRYEVQTVSFIDFVNGADIRMIQSRGCAGFAFESLESLRVTREIGGEQFESDHTPELQVFGFVDYTHAASADGLKNSIVGDRLALQE